MNFQDYNLLTQDEIDAVVAEVLQENGIGRISEKDEDDEYLEKDGPKSKRDRTAGAGTPTMGRGQTTYDPKGGLQYTGTQTGKLGASGKQRGEKVTDDDLVDGPSRLPAPGAAGKAVSKLGDKIAGDPGDDSMMGKARRAVGGAVKGVGAAAGAVAGNTGTSPDMYAQGAQDKAKARARGNIGPGGLQRTADKVNPNDAYDAGDGREGSAGREGAKRVDMTNTWHNPGASSVPQSVKADINSVFPSRMQMSIEDVLDGYLKLTYGGDESSMSRENARAHWLSRFKQLVNRIDQQKDPEMVSAAEDAVARQLDSMLHKAVLFGQNNNVPPEKIQQAVNDDTPVPPPDRDSEEGGGGSDIPIPVNKKLSGDQRDQAGMSKGAAGSLASQLSKLFPDVDKSIITQILKDVAGQLKANNIPVQEGKRLAFRLILEQQVKSMILNEKRYDTDKDAEIVKTLVRQLALGKGEVKKVNKVKGVVKKPALVAVNKDGVPRVYSVDKGKDGQDSAEAGFTQAKKWASSGGSQDSDLFKKFKETLKRLDLHTSEGRAAAKEDDQAFLGAYRYYKAMVVALKALKTDRLEKSTPKIMKMVEPLNEKSFEHEGAAGKDFKTWLANMINIFKEEGFADKETGMGKDTPAKDRAMKAMRAARKGRMPGSDSKSPETKADKVAAGETEKAAGAETSRRSGSAGTINMKSVVGPRLKQGGIDLKSPEGQALQKKMQKVIRRFIKKNLQRVGKGDLKVIAENKQLQAELKNIILEHLRQHELL